MTSVMELMTKEERTTFYERVAQVVRAGAVPSFIQLCAGPRGPLPAKDLPFNPDEEGEGPIVEGIHEGREAGEGEPEPAAGAKKSAARKQKGKKEKLVTGMAEAQSWCSACLRLISLVDEHKGGLLNQGVVRYLLPLLQSSVSLARWNARQVLIQLSLLPTATEVLNQYRAPCYIHHKNIPASHYKRLSTTPAEDPSARMAPQLLGVVLNKAQNLSLNGGVSPPPASSSPTRLPSASPSARGPHSRRSSITGRSESPPPHTAVEPPTHISLSGGLNGTMGPREATTPTIGGTPRGAISSPTITTSYSPRLVA